MGWIAIGLTLMLILFMARYAFTAVPQKQYAIFNIFGKRWRKEQEGLAFFIPFLEDKQFYSAELDRLEINVEVMSKDKLGIRISGSLEFVPDFELLFQYDLTKAKQAKAIEDSIKDEIGSLAGTKEAEAFILQREAIQTIINCRLRLAVMPHRSNKYPKVKECGGAIPVNDRIDFYNGNLKKIQDSLKKEKRDFRRSHIEESYGIDVSIFNLSGVDYGEVTKKAFELEKQAQAKAKAADSELKLAESFKKFDGVSGLEAINASQTSLGKAAKTIYSIEGKPIEIKFGGGA